jgi:hypothetical protein
LTVNGDEENNIISVGDLTGTGRTNKTVNVNAGDGNDTINYIGTGPDAQLSVLSGGTGNDTITVGSAVTIDDRATGASGNDTYDFGTNLGRQTVRFGADNGSDTVRNYSVGDATTLPDVIDFASAGIDASTVTVSESGGNTVFTINGSTVTVEGVTGLEFNRHWTALGTYTPPVAAPVVAEEPVSAAPAEPEIIVFDAATTGGTQAISGDFVLDFSSFDFDAATEGRQGAANGLQITNEAPVSGSMVEDEFYYDANTGVLSIDTGTDGEADFSVTLNQENGHPLSLVADDFRI